MFDYIFYFIKILNDNQGVLSFLALIVGYYAIVKPLNEGNKTEVKNKIIRVEFIKSILIKEYCFMLHWLDDLESSMYENKNQLDIQTIWLPSKARVENIDLLLNPEFLMQCSEREVGRILEINFQIKYLNSLIQKLNNSVNYRSHEDLLLLKTMFYDDISPYFESLRYNLFIHWFHCVYSCNLEYNSRFEFVKTVQDKIKFAEKNGIVIRSAYNSNYFTVDDFKKIRINCIMFWNDDLQAKKEGVEYINLKLLTNPTEINKSTLENAKLDQLEQFKLKS